MTKRDSSETTQGIACKIASLTARELKTLRDNSSDWQKWCLYNACLHFREALSKNNLQDAQMWEYIAMELARKVDDIVVQPKK